MTTALTKTNQPTEVEVIATTPAEMADAQGSLIQWCARKIHDMKLQASELHEAWQQAVKNKWRTQTLRRHAALAKNRVTFYEKILAALEAGYTIVPNFPITLFAIRTDKDKPKPCTWVGSYERSAFEFEQVPNLLPAGEGENKNSIPMVATDTTKEGEKTKYTQSAADWQDEIEFPIAMAKVKIMKATSRAMAMKIFDQFGILHPAAANADPVICAEIMDPRPTGYGVQKRVTFIIAWHLDTRSL